jgi:phage-related protein
MNPLEWVGSSPKDLREFPRQVQTVPGFALKLAQLGDKHPSAKPLRGFHGAGVLEIVEDHDGDTYRAVYTVQFAGMVYVLHALQKKSHHGRETPHSDLDLIQARLRRAEELYADWLRRSP